MVNNVFFSVLYQAITMISSFITTPYLSRVLGSAGMGDFVMADTYTQYFILLGGIGLNVYAAREIGYVRDDKTKLKTAFWELTILRMGTFAVSICLYYLIFILGGYRNSILVKISIINVMASMFDISWYFIGIENFKKMSIRNAIIKILAVILIFTCVKKENQVWLYALITYSANLLGQCIMWNGISKDFFREIEISKQDILKHFKGTLTIFVSTIMIQVYTLLDRLMLGEMSGNVQVAYYDNAQKLIKAITFSLTAGIQALMPGMANDFINYNIKKYTDNVYTTFRFVGSLSMPFCFGLIAVSGIFSEWFYGKNFVGIDNLLSWGAPVIISIGWSCILAYNVLAVLNKQNYLTLAVGIGAALDIVINLIFIKEYGAMATTVSTLVAEVSGLIIMFYSSRSIINFFKILKSSIRYLVFSIVMSIIVYKIGAFLPHNILGTFLQVCCGAGIYFFCLIITRDIVVKEIYRLIKKKVRETKR